MDNIKSTTRKASTDYTNLSTTDYDCSDCTNYKPVPSSAHYNALMTIDYWLLNTTAVGSTVLCLVFSVYYLKYCLLGARSRRIRQ